jgi:hypothetical protein
MRRNCRKIEITLKPGAGGKTDIELALVNLKPGPDNSIIREMLITAIYYHNQTLIKNSNE